MEREQIEQLESQWKQAMLADDVTAMDKLLSEDYLGVTAGGDLVTKSQQLDRMRTRKVSVTKLDTTEIKFKLIGQIGIVTSLAQIEAESDGRTITGQYRYTRIYQRLPNGSWKITSFEATRVPGSGR
jgi:ketosteroid isomerase-like protein